MQLLTRQTGVLLCGITVLLCAGGVMATPLNNGLPAIGIYWSRPQLTSCALGSSMTCAQAAANADFDFYLGLGSNSWPETCGATPSDDGELAALKGAGLYFIASIYETWNSNAIMGPATVSCQKKMLSINGGAQYWLGQHLFDEPIDGTQGVGQPVVSNIPTAVSNIRKYDGVASHIQYGNFTPAFLLYPPTDFTSWVEALRSVYAGQFDDYTLVGKDRNVAAQCMSVGDYNTIGNDCFVMISADSQLMRAQLAAGQPFWSIPEDGSDELTAGSNNSNQMSAIISGTVMQATGGQLFGPTWINLQVTGGGVTNATIMSVVDSSHAILSQSGNGQPAVVAVTGGALSATGTGTTDCVASANICVVGSTEYRATPSQVFAEALAYYIEGASATNWFCHDSGEVYNGDEFCLGDSADGGPASTTTYNNLIYVNGTIKSLGKILMSGSYGQCSTAYWGSDGAIATNSSCSFVDGGGSSLTLTTANQSVPAHVIEKSYNGHHFVFVQPLARSPGAAGTVITACLSSGFTGLAVKFDSNGHYDPNHALAVGSHVENSGGCWQETYGANGDDYQTIVFTVTP